MRKRSRRLAPLHYGLLLLILGSSANLAAQESFRTLGWGDLLPPGATFDPPIVDHDSPFDVQNNAKIELVEALDGQKVRLPGYVVPLGGEARAVSEFLLVPYLGACIHVPPPPPNQMVHVHYPPGVSVNELWDPVWVFGTLHANPTQSAYGVVGYRLEGARLDRYTDEDVEAAAKAYEEVMMEEIDD